jgi:carboxymethylenebutenolidase
MAYLNTGDLNDMQLYLVEEEAEKWQKGRISRREFIRRVTLIAGGAAAASSVLMALGCGPTAPEAQPTATATGAGAEATATAEPVASPTDQTPTAQAGRDPYHVPEGDPAVRAEMVQFPTADGSATLQAYLAASALPMAGPANPAGVLVIHENRGLTDYIKDVCRRLAKARYTALGVDLISRQGGTDAHPDEGERIGIIGQLPPEQVIADLSAGLDYLKSRNDVSPERLGAIGFCFGGGYAWRMATRRPDLKAVAAYYGPNPPLEDVPKIKAAVLGIYGALDTRIISQVPQLEEALKKAGITYQIKIYEGADHAFHRDTGPNYNPAAAKDAWELTLQWFGQYL